MEATIEIKMDVTDFVKGFGEILPIAEEELEGIVERILEKNGYEPESTKVKIEKHEGKNRD